MLSQTAEYALRAVVYLASQGEQGPLRVDAIAAGLGIPANYLAKTLQALVRARVLLSTRGPHGGFRLARRPAAITLYDIVAPYGELDARNRCLLGRPECSDRNPCAAHHAWKQTADELTRFFRTTTVADVAATPAVTVSPPPSHRRRTA